MAPRCKSPMSIFPRRLRPFGLALLLVGLSAASPLALTAMDRLGAQPGLVAATLPDTLLMLEWPPPSRSARQFLTGRRVAALEPSSLTPRPLFDGTQQPAVSPDGREVYIVRYQEMGDVLRVDLVALTSDSLAPRWTANVATLSAAELDQPNGMSLANFAIAVTGDSVYVARTSGSSGTTVASGRDGQAQVQVAGPTSHLAPRINLVTDQLHELLASLVGLGPVVRIRWHIDVNTIGPVQH
jgi:hypothetical protein